MKKAVLLALLLGGCTAAPARNDVPVSLTEYSRCNLEASRAVSRQPGDPVSLAIAARGLCAKEELALLNELRTARGEVIQTYRLLDAYKSAAAESNVTEIVRTRAQEAATRR